MAVHFATRVGQTASRRCVAEACRNDLTANDNRGYSIPAIVGTPRAIRRVMDLTIWLPALFLLGLVVLGLMFLFTSACAKV
jgi:hypothetical protein